MNTEDTAIYKYTTGQDDETMSIEEAQLLLDRLSGDGRVADPYDSDDGEWNVYEIYDDGETVADYPDGNPYADSLWMPK